MTARRLDMRSTIKNQVLAMLQSSNGPRSSPEIAEILGLHPKTVSHTLGELEAEGAVERTSGRKWVAIG